MADITLLTSQGGIKRWRGRSDGTAIVESKSYFAEEALAEEGDAYIFHGVCRTAAATGGVFLYVKNTSSDTNIRIGRVYIDPYALTDDDLLCTQVVNPSTVTNGTDITSSGVIQKNTGKVNALTDSGVLLKCSDASSDMTFTGGDKFHEFAISDRASIQRDMKGTNIVAPGGEWLLCWTTEDGAAATGDDQVSFSVNCYLEPVDRE